MCANIGHAHEVVIAPSRSRRTRSPTPIRSWRPSRARGSARSSPRSRPATSTCSSSRTAAPRPTRTRSASRASCTGRHKILARYRSYHGGTAGAITLTGDPRRWAAEPGMPGVVHVARYHSGAGQRAWDRVDDCLARPRGRDPLEGPQTIAGVRARDRTSARTASSCRPTATCRACATICDRHGILLIADEVMSRLRAHGRVVRGRSLERRARHHHDGEGPDVSATCRSARSACGRHIAEAFQRHVVLRRPHLQQPPARLRGGARARSRSTRTTKLIEQARSAWAR